MGQWRTCSLRLRVCHPKYAMSSRLHTFEHVANGNRAGIWKLPEKERVKQWEWRKIKQSNQVFSCLCIEECQYV